MRPGEAKPTFKCIKCGKETPNLLRCAAVTQAGINDGICPECYKKLKFPYENVIY